MNTNEVITDILAHHGVKGMKWGVRRSTGTTPVTVSDKRKKLKSTGGKGFPAHSDAVKAKTIGQIRKKSGSKALSNQELQTYQQRLNLEQSVKRLDYQNKNAAAKFVASVLGNSGKSAAQEVGNAAGSKAAKKVILRAGLAAATV